MFLTLVVMTGGLFLFANNVQPADQAQVVGNAPLQLNVSMSLSLNVGSDRDRTFFCRRTMYLYNN